MRIWEDRLVKDFKLYSLYVNTSGYGYIEFWPTRKRKYLFPNDKGYIFLRGKKINLKRIIYEKIYPRIDLEDKIVVKLTGNIFSIGNLYAVTRNQYVNFKKYKLQILKNESTGECVLIKSAREKGIASSLPGEYFNDYYKSLLEN